MTAESAGQTDPASPQLADYLQIGLEELENRLDFDRQSQEKWSVIADEALRVARTVPSPRMHVGSYPELTDRETKLDLKF